MGGNLPSAVGTPLDTQVAALECLLKAGVEVEAVSCLYRTSPVPVSDQPDFINCALRVRTHLAPQALLDVCQETEVALGRQKGERWSARTLDIDVLAYGDRVLPDEQAWRDVTCNPDPAYILDQAVVPHPRLHLRGFVLMPLNDIAPEWRHPVLGTTVREMLTKLPASDRAGIERMAVDFGRFSTLQPGRGAV
nr:2-amino-4-hydroxy-6-hydroxymethyldihydropteridine diphosphokinase [Kordiimonas marina]